MRYLLGNVSYIRHTLEYRLSLHMNTHIRAAGTYLHTNKKMNKNKNHITAFVTPIRIDKFSSVKNSNSYKMCCIKPVMANSFNNTFVIIIIFQSSVF